VWALLLLVAAGVVATGTWGLSQSRGAGRGAVAAVGELVPVTDGAVRVDAVSHLPDDPMKMSGPGMAMPMSPGPGFKPLPKGFHRFAVDLTVFAKVAPGLRLHPAGFRVSATGLAPAQTTSLDLQSVFVPDGGFYSQRLEFQAPTSARDLVLRAPGGARPIALGIGAASPGMAMRLGMTTSP